MELRVGQTGFRGDLMRYARRFDLVEVVGERQRLPRRARLREWRQAVSPDFVFSVVLPRSVAGLEPTADDEPLAFALQVAEILTAGWLVLRTPASVTPGARARRRLEALVARLPRDAHRLAWEPAGVWDLKEVDDLAHQLGLHSVRDLGRHPAPSDPVVYTRLRALGVGRVGDAAVERAARELSGREAAFVVVEGPNAARARRILLEELAPDSGAPSEPGPAAEVS